MNIGFVDTGAITEAIVMPAGKDDTNSVLSLIFRQRTQKDSAAGYCYSRRCLRPLHIHAPMAA